MSITSICNRALSKAGARSTITSLDEASAEAVACSIHYDPDRQTLLRAAHWNFARYQLSLALLGSALDTPVSAPTPWAYKYAYPSDCLKLRFILWQPTDTPNSIAPDVGQPYAGYLRANPNNRFVVASDIDADSNPVKVILTNVPNAIGVYTKDLTDPDMFDPSFTTALVNLLASDLIMPLSGNVGQMQSMLAYVQEAVTAARVSDGNEGLTSTDHTPDWIAARGTPWLCGGAFDGPGIWYNGWDAWSPGI